MISGKTTLIAHIGYPTHSFKAPLIYNPYFGLSPQREQKRHGKLPNQLIYNVNQG